MVKLPIEYSDKPVTPFAGMALMKRLIDQTGIREHLATLDLPQDGSNRAHDPVQVIESFGLVIWTGAGRYSHCADLTRSACKTSGPRKPPSASSWWPTI